ncbi:MAG TPA: RecX family transcriptional regulator [Blastocatellia bacterium]|jgi:regulatory protein
MSRTRGREAEGQRALRRTATPGAEPDDQGEGSGQPPRRAANPDKLRKRIMARALNILAAKARSEGQLREQLLAKAWAEPGLVDECILRLKELGYVNDDLFAHSYATSRVGARAIGRSRVARELAGKKVARKTIDEALDTVFEEVGEEALIDRAIQKRMRTHGRPADRGSAKRMFDHLARLGFEYDLIIRKLQALRAEMEGNDE